MSIKINFQKIFYTFSVLFLAMSGYFFLQLSNSERAFLHYPQSPVIEERKTVEIQLKGGSFYITEEENAAYDFNQKALYVAFMTTILFVGATYKAKEAK